MAELTISREQLNTLISSEQARGSSDITRIINDIYLTYRQSEIVTPRAPALSRPQRIVTMTLAGTTYSDRPAWTMAWQRLYADNQRQGLQVFPDRETEIQPQNITDSAGTPLPLIQPVSTVPIRENTGVNNVGITIVGEQGVPGVGIGSVRIDSNGDLRVELDDGQDVNAGQVVPTLGIGSVTQNPSGQGSTATITGVAPNYQLNLVLDTAATTGNFVGTVELTSQGQLPQSATRKDYVDKQNIAISIALGS
jgi:hypothetical protein